MEVYIPKTCEWPGCEDPPKKYKSYCNTHYSRVYKVVDKESEAKEFKQSFKESKKLNFEEQENDTLD